MVNTNIARNIFGIVRKSDIFMTNSAQVSYDPPNNAVKMRMKQAWRQSCIMDKAPGCQPGGVIFMRIAFNCKRVYMQGGIIDLNKTLHGSLSQGMLAYSSLAISKFL